MSVANYLRDAGLKVDVRALVSASTDFMASLQGKASELREKGRITESQESFIAAIKVALEKASDETSFKDLYLTELDPDWMAKREMMQHKGPEEDMDEKTRDDLSSSLALCIVALDFANDFFSLNEIRPGEPIGEQLGDPLVSVHVDPRSTDPNDPLLRERLEVDMEKIYEVSIDESSSALFREIDEEFQENYYQEYQMIMALGLVVEDLVEKSKEGKIDIEDFADMCMLEFGDRFTVSIDASLVAEEIARSLEKRGMLKMKGDTIKWKA